MNNGFGKLLMGLTLAVVLMANASAEPDQVIETGLAELESGVATIRLATINTDWLVIHTPIDDDGDGVDDSVDNCLNTPPGEAVDANGCAASERDTDSDGIVDANDLCPDTAPGTLVGPDGCEAFDTDGDGVFDNEDLCPGTTPGAEVDADGCEVTYQLTVTSIGTEDGWVREAGENGNAGGTVKNALTGNGAIRAGDGGSRPQYKGFVSFDITSLPVDAVIKSARLEMSPTPAKVNGDVSAFGTLFVDFKAGGFGGSPALATGDFQASADLTKVASLDTDTGLAPLNSDALTAMGDAFLAGERVQFRIAFDVDDNNNSSADYLGFFGGDEGNSSVHPRLVIDYVTPPANTAPQVSISSPANDAEFDLGTQTTFTAAASDLEDGVISASIAWSSDIDGSLGSGASVMFALSEGVHTITASITDSGALSASDSVSVTVTAPDEDNDGVSDANDSCPNTPNGETANAEGCSPSQVDSDQDGIFDNIDICPDTPPGELANGVGCSPSQVDSDGDSVSDAIDMCPLTPLDETADALGCSESQRDTDGDGINDALDQCPGTPEGETANAAGCSASQIDTDGDGIYDPSDICPETPEGETADSNGCSASQRDTDTDGINDALDQCPATPTDETANSDGCSPSQLDSDEDGISDAVDSCPATPPGESVDAEGCADSQKDSDNDGVNDAVDQCPASANAHVDPVGCPYGIVYSDSVDGSNPQLLEGATLDQGQDVYIFVNVPDGTGIDEVVWDLNSIPAYSSDIEFPYDLNANGEFANFSTAGANSVAAQIKWSDGETTNASSNFIVLEASTEASFSSIAAEDGWVREAGENGNVGGTVKNAITGTGGIRAGDGGSRPQYKGFISFDISSLPADATISSARIEMSPQPAVIAGNVSAFGTLFVDFKAGGFGGNVALATGDFQASADLTKVASLSIDTGIANLSPEALTALESAIISGDRAQFRIAFDVDDNNNSTADYVAFYAADAADSAVRPRLIVEYSTPPANTAPIVTITSPANGASFEVGTMVTLAGTANDFEEGILSTSLDWASSLDGFLGTSDSLTLTLSEGVHTITASVTDSGDLTGSRNISLTITASDEDADGVSDGLDQCPETPEGESVDADGCSATQRDSDNDGLIDAVDQCPETPEGESVNANGCSASQIDSDNDGIFDSNDSCPDTPTDETANAEGCSPSQVDTDLDGIFDNIDICPETPFGEVANAEGCSLSQIDTDNDSVNDAVDICPDTPEAETADALGCSPSQRDSDGDGINDALDQCPATPVDETANSAGCSPSQTDSDNDSVYDSVDQCPDTPESETADANGCSPSQKDTDGDGVNDALDQCPETPVAETANAQGCSPSQTDTDGDGIYDTADSCPETPAHETADSNGCSPSQKDTDGDGVNDALDQCPETPTSETANAQGCSPSQADDDNDGIVDANDICPMTPEHETADSNGCSPSQKDTDGDGINDALDQCSETPAAETANAQGCSPSQADDDNDGIVDAIDICPMTPASETADANGCSDSQKDTDGDGINDALDQCPETPPGETPNAAGCSNTQIDSDGDGLVDAFDLCPETPPGESVDVNGCADSQLDSDNDGVNNAIDQCPMTQPGANVDAVGCEITDSDGDGVLDDVDQCPGTPESEPVDVDGCELVSELTVQAEDYDRYSDTTNGNTGGAYRNDDVDIGTTSDGGAGGHYVGWTVAGEWLEFDVTLSAGTYEVTTRVASKKGPGNYKVELAGQLVGSKSGIATGAWQTYTTQTVGSITLAKGTHTLRFELEANSLNINWIKLTATDLLMDSDKDGVTDDIDLCPGTPAGVAVDATGCVTDSDGDGVNDDSDLCPGTPMGTAVDSNGCELVDTDDDGVYDINDQCPLTPMGEVADAQGCSASQRDSDGDGLNDAVDSCPETPPGESVDGNGCSASQIDSDNDGIFDSNDICPDTPSDETANANGCSPSQVDTDLDGIFDDLDQCPETPMGEIANSAGCSASQIDTDNDGVSDAIDLCPMTPDGETADALGCSATQRDTDGDGINDALDQCPETPIDETANANGCSISQTDTDGDGIFDPSDMCPETPMGEVADSNGCSPSQKDTDGDGVNDALDQCPETPAAETANAQGCSPSQTDTDGDGVYDTADSCPETPVDETADNNGCSPSQKDTDNDGINDAIDQCPETPVDETANANGCSPSQTDSDGDGIFDSVDICPDTPVSETADLNGCSPSQKDTDNDGVNDAIDLCPGSAHSNVYVDGCDFRVFYSASSDQAGALPLQDAELDQGEQVYIFVNVPNGDGIDEVEWDFNVSAPHSTDVSYPFDLEADGGLTTLSEWGITNVVARIKWSDGSETEALTDFVVLEGSSTTTATFVSIGSEDGWVRETNENSGVGGTVKTTATGTGAIRIGDGGSRPQYKGFVSFNINSLPADANITSARLQMSPATITGDVSAFGALNIEFKAGGYGGNNALATSDFQASSDLNNVGTIDIGTGVGEMNGEILAALESARANSERAQFRLVFDIDDNNNSTSDYVGFSGGLDANSALHPRLVIEYSTGGGGGNTAPVVNILAPGDGHTVSQGTMVTLTGSASDNEDGDLSSSIAWSSDLDGDLGTSDSLSVSLSEGVHTITASVTDNGSLSASESITVTVNAVTSSQATFTSIASEDGRVLESGENTDVGGTVKDSTGSNAIRVGDSNGDTQFKGFVSFNITSLPAGANISAASLQMTPMIKGDVSAFGTLYVDMNSGGFSGATALESNDWQSAADLVKIATVNTDTGVAELSSEALTLLQSAHSNSQRVQFRLSFDIDDNDNNSADYVGFIPATKAILLFIQDS